MLSIAVVCSLVEVTQLRRTNKELEEYRAKDKQFYEQGVKFSYEEKRGNELKEILGMALRNTVIRESMFGSQTYDNGLYAPKDETTTKEVE